MTDFDYKQRASTSEWDKNHEATFEDKDNIEALNKDATNGLIYSVVAKDIINEVLDEESGD